MSRAPVYVVTLNGVPVTADRVDTSAAIGTEQSSPFLGAAGRVGGSVDIDWSTDEIVRAAGLPHPWHPTFTKLPALPVTVALVMHDTDGAPLPPETIFTGTTRTTRASMRAGNVITRCEDTPSRLWQDVTCPPIAAVMPPVGDGPRRWVGLHPIHHTARALLAAGVPPHQPQLAECVLLAQMAGTAWPTVGEVLASQHEDYGAGHAPYFAVTADGRPMVLHPAITNSTAAWSPTNAPWLLCVDLVPWNGDTAVHHRVQRGDGAGFGIELDGNTLRVVTYAAGGAATTRATITRVAALTRIVVTYSNTGTNNLQIADNRSSGVTTVTVGTNLLNVASATVTVEGFGDPGTGTVQVARSTNREGVRAVPIRSAIRRAVWDSTSTLTASPYIPARQAIGLLTEQARAEGLALWIDEQGIVQVASQSVLLGGDVAHVITDDDTVSGRIDLDDIDTSVSGGHVVPASAVRIAYRNPVVDVREVASILLAAGSRETLQSGDVVERFFHPQSGTDWLDVDVNPVLWHGVNSPELHRRIGSGVGGYRIHRDNNTIFGLTGPMLTADMALIDPATVLYTATIGDLEAGYEMVTMPNPNDSATGLRGRGSDPLPEVRGRAATTWSEETTDPLATSAPAGGGTHTVDVGWWVHSPSALTARRAAEAAVLADPPVEVTVRCAVAPVMLGEKVTVATITGSGLALTGVVIERRIDSATARMSLTVRLTVPPVVGLTYGGWHEILDDLPYGSLSGIYPTYGDIPSEVP